MQNATIFCIESVYSFCWSSAMFFFLPKDPMPHLFPLMFARISFIQVLQKVFWFTISSMYNADSFLPKFNDYICVV